MFRKLLVPAILSLAVLGLAVDSAQAQLFARRGTVRERRMERRDMRRGNVATTDGGTVMSQSGARISNYYEPGTTAGNAATVRVILPDAAAKVYFDGTATQQTGANRLFETPALTQGQSSYLIRVTWMQGTQEMSQERTVMVMPGRTSLVNFTRP
jgi:uncharacterized protein (TIGR03000 family)